MPSAPRLLFIAGAFISAVAQDVTMLLIGRLLVGLAIGVASMLTPLPVDGRGWRRQRDDDDRVDPPDRSARSPAIALPEPRWHGVLSGTFYFGASGHLAGVAVVSVAAYVGFSRSGWGQCSGY